MVGRQKRSERTVERLVTAAADQFARHGYVRATLADISSRAGVTKGALFFHFASKDELAVAVQERGRELMERSVARMGPAEGSYLQAVVDLTFVLQRLLREDVFVRASVRIAREHKDAGLAEESADSADSRGYSRPAATGVEELDFYRVWLELLWDLMGEARRSGELGRTVADASARTLVTAVVAGVEALTWLGAQRAESEAWLTDLWSLLLPALRPERPGRRPVRTTAPVLPAARGGSY
ncbi:TetR/AcrR family transcriptional regulator [Streptomyces luteolifulvus]|uniref:TetR/AcrR family transcriptional regulator n=1 Tax=Streptomyces luteolifulvus TaxID=2615112 RepID=A0A6H9USE9_9ACTN|nr:ScbR family autoregulator-binding transcription factor [Streptomyces luteolifulvus]KAB1141370.1 TetR/AcrR family transcriptional regulator [Streptomyces luteolifulvus]